MGDGIQTGPTLKGLRGTCTLGVYEGFYYFFYKTCTGVQNTRHVTGDKRVRVQMRNACEGTDDESEEIGAAVHRTHRVYTYVHNGGHHHEGCWYLERVNCSNRIRPSDNGVMKACLDKNEFAVDIIRTAMQDYGRKASTVDVSCKAVITRNSCTFTS